MVEKRKNILNLSAQNINLEKILCAISQDSLWQFISITLLDITAQLLRAFDFAIRIIRSLFLLNSKFEDYSPLL